MQLHYGPVNVSCVLAFIYQVVQLVVIQESPGHVSTQLHVCERKLRGPPEHFTQIIKLFFLLIKLKYKVTFIRIDIGLLTVL